jgi:hypothetical protein
MLRVSYEKSDGYSQPEIRVESTEVDVNEALLNVIFNGDEPLAGPLGLPEAPAPNAKVTMTIAEMQELMKACFEGKKIYAIKEVRRLTGLGLKEAKGVVDVASTPKPVFEYHDREDAPNEYNMVQGI